MKEKETEALFRLPFWCQRDGRRRQAKVSARRQRQASSLEPHIDINRETEEERERQGRCSGRRVSHATISV